MDTKTIAIGLVIGLLLGTGLGYTLNIFQISGYKNQITSIQSQVNSLTSEKTNLQTQVNSLSSEKSSLQSQVSSLQTQITSKNNEITNLNQQITSLKSQIPVPTPEPEPEPETPISTWELVHQWPALGPMTSDRIGYEYKETQEFEFANDVKAWKLEIEWTGVSQLRLKGLGEYWICIEKVHSDGTTEWLTEFRNEEGECDKPGSKSIIIYDVSEVYFIDVGVCNQLINLKVYSVR